MRRFQVKNEGFDCEFCGESIPPAKGTCRDHCPHCLSSKHVDVFPGDRANPCKGRLKAVGYYVDGKKGLMLEFLCQSCGQKVRNKALRDGEQPDDYTKILELNAAGS